MGLFNFDDGSRASIKQRQDYAWKHSQSTQGRGLLERIAQAKVVKENKDEVSAKEAEMIAEGWRRTPQGNWEKS